MKKTREQFTLGIQTSKLSFVENWQKKAGRFFQTHPYWQSGFTWLSILSAVIFGSNSIYVIYTNFDKMPDEIAMLFAERNGVDVMKNKYLLYFLPISVIIIGITQGILIGKIFYKYPRLAKFTNVVTFFLSVFHMLSIYKIVSIYQ